MRVEACTARDSVPGVQGSENRYAPLCCTEPKTPGQSHVSAGVVLRSRHSSLAGLVFDVIARLRLCYLFGSARAGTSGQVSVFSPRPQGSRGRPSVRGVQGRRAEASGRGAARGVKHEGGPLRMVGMLCGWIDAGPDWQLLSLNALLPDGWRCGTDCSGRDKPRPYLAVANATALLLVSASVVRCRNRFSIPPFS